MILIDMEMPKNCWSCPCSSTQYGYCEITAERFLDSRPQSCPLIELPPHGDLIDRDALMKQCEMGGNCNTCEHSSYGIWCDKGSEFVNVCEAVSDAPTIIEADKPLWKRMVMAAKELEKSIPEEAKRKAEAVICETVCREVEDEKE